MSFRDEIFLSVFSIWHSKGEGHAVNEMDHIEEILKHHFSSMVKYNSFHALI